VVIVKTAKFVGNTIKTTNYMAVSITADFKVGIKPSLRIEFFTYWQNADMVPIVVPKINLLWNKHDFGVSISPLLKGSDFPV
jgi:hypothetical protein